MDGKEEAVCDIIISSSYYHPDFDNYLSYSFPLFVILPSSLGVNRKSLPRIIMPILQPRPSTYRLETLTSLTNDLDKASQFYLFLELVKPKTHGIPHYSQSWLQLTIQ